MKRDSAHLAWVRTLPCAVGYRCAGPIEAHHVRIGTGGGMGTKPLDCWAVPMCRHHHQQGHTIGWETFQRRYGIDLRTMAERVAAAGLMARSMADR